MSDTSNIKPAANWRGEFFSARYFLVRALALALLFLAAQLAGLREYTTFLSGTTAGPGVDIRLSAFLGMLYIALYLGCVVLAPILVMAGALLALWQKFRERTRAGTIP